MSRKRQKTSGESPTAAPQPSPPVRLQRILAQSGFGSRRECEQLILEGRVEIDGQVANQLGVRADPLQQVIRVDGTVIKLQGHQYFVVNKPVGVLSTCWDPSGRARVIDLIPTEQRVYNVGRLDKSSEGLILVTNDGELANRLTHPRYGVDKTYLVTVVGRPTVESIKTLQRGVYLSEGPARVNSIRIKRHHKTTSELLMVLDEGRNREIRRLLAHVGHKVLHLKRIAIGPLRLADLPPGASRRLERHEVASLKRAASDGGSAPGSVRKRATAKSRSPSSKMKTARGRKPLARQSGDPQRSERPETARSASRGQAGTGSGGKRAQRPASRSSTGKSRSASRQKPAGKTKPPGKKPLGKKRRSKS